MNLVHILTAIKCDKHLHLFASQKHKINGKLKYS